MSLEHSEVNENNFLKIVVNLGIFGVKHYIKLVSDKKQISIQLLKRNSNRIRLRERIMLLLKATVLLIASFNLVSSQVGNFAGFFSSRLFIS